MRRNPGWRTRMPRAAVILIGAAIVAVVGALAVIQPPSRQPAALPRAGQHATVRPQPSRSPAVLPKASCGGAVTHFLDSGTQILSTDPGALT